MNKCKNRIYDSERHIWKPCDICDFECPPGKIDENLLLTDEEIRPYLYIGGRDNHNIAGLLKAQLALDQQHEQERVGRIFGEIERYSDISSFVWYKILKKQEGIK